MKTLLINWRPTVAGLIAFISLVGSLTGWLTPAQVSAITAAAAAFGLLSAKQQNVTGGSVGQPSTPEALAAAHQADARTVLKA